MRKKLIVGSLFCGAGGFDLGFMNTGHQIAWAIDNDSDCVDTYSYNFGHEAILADVSNVNFSNLNDIDLIIGGFPCQGFSMANKHRAADDDRNALYHQFVRAVREKKPKYFLAENVRGILSLEKGAAIQRIVADFSSAGYDVEYKLFNASDHGVPQNRYRVFIWGIRTDLDQKRIWPEVTTAHNKISVGEALQGIPEPDSEHNMLNHVGSQYKITNRNFTGCRTTNPDKPCPTIIARGNGKGGVNAIQHPNNHRRMTVREQAIIQTFPLDFKFIGSMSSCYRQIGNAVPVRLAEKFGEVFRKVK
jgi:DNA (cytosine-5)-methyltransferase 1